LETLDIITISFLSILLLILLVVGFVEIYIHKLSLEKIPIRIHVNGTRGKSSVTRLIAAGLRAGGLNTFAKTTGSTPRIINNLGNDVELHRLRSASIGEQIKLIRYFSKYKPDILVMECMAVNPQYQWISEHKIVKSTIGVITNVRPDHLDEMGTTLKDIALSMSNTIPFNSKVFTSDEKCYDILNNVAKNRGTILELPEKNSFDKKILSQMNFIEHPENIELALKVCEFAGVNKDVALGGMIKAKPDPGALFVWDIIFKKNKNKFVSAFAANDPSSTMKVWNLIVNGRNEHKCIFLNTRNDRRYRTIQLIELVLKHIKPDVFILRADDVDSIIKNYEKSNIKLIIYNMKTAPKKVVSTINNLNNHLVVGIGNIVGWGDQFLSEIKKHKIK
tara:strand:+ start:139 stop:1311 length:1173 start_codon:yes stop_codon:yes gene_type:complete